MGGMEEMYRKESIGWVRNRGDGWVGGWVGGGLTQSRLRVAALSFPVMEAPALAANIPTPATYIAA